MRSISLLIFKFLIRKSELTEECLINVFKKGCTNPHGDIVLLKVRVESGDLAWDKEIIVGMDKMRGCA